MLTFSIKKYLKEVYPSNPTIKGFFFFFWKESRLLVILLNYCYPSNANNVNDQIKY